MDSAKFKKCGYQMVELAAEYMETLDKRTPLPEVTPGYLAKIIPTEAPEQPENWEEIMKDIEPVVMKGMSHWQHRMFFAYFPAGNSWPSVLGDILSNALGASGATWDQCPVMTELEIIIMDWCAKFLGLPKFFYSHFSNPQSIGGGVIQTSASDCILLSMIAAREAAVKKARKKFPDKPRAVIMRQLVGYCSKQCHSCVEKGSMIALFKLRIFEPDETGGVRAEFLRAAIRSDINDGLIPFYYCAILGSTGICAFDDLMELGPVIEEHDMYMHVDGAYAGSSFVCPEMRYLSYGLEYGMSFNTNCNKWMLTNFDCSLHWMRDKSLLINCLSGNDQSLYNHPIIDYKYWGLPGTRRFRSVKLWFVLRNYGIIGLQNYIRSHINLAKMLERCLQRDDRFEVVGTVRVALVCFRLKGTNRLNKRYFEAMEFSKRLHMVPSTFREKYVIRFAAVHQYLTEADIMTAWDVIDEYASVTIRLREMELKEGKDSNDKEALTALTPLFEKQHEHDTEEQLHPDSKHDAEEKEAMTKLKDITEHHDEVTKANPLLALATEVDESDEDEEGVGTYDKLILSHPETLKITIPEYSEKFKHPKFFMGGHLTHEHIEGRRDTT